MEWAWRVTSLPDRVQDWPEWARDELTQETPLGPRVLLGKFMRARTLILEHDYPARLIESVDRDSGEAGDT